MNAKNWLSFFLGAISATVVCLILYWYFGEDVELNDVLPSLVTGVVTFAALLFTYLTNKEQRELQIKTTIENEWIEKIRFYIAELVNQAPYLAVMKISNFQKKLEGKDASEFVTKIEAYTLNLTYLQVYLNRKDALDLKLLQSAIRLHQTIQNINDMNEMPKLLDLALSVSDAAHTLFEDKF